MLLRRDLGFDVRGVTGRMLFISNGSMWHGPSLDAARSAGTLGVIDLEQRDHMGEGAFELH